MSWKKYLSVFISAIFSGFMITFGATVYLICVSEAQKYLGMFLFGAGLFTIIHFNLYLYTGKVGYVLDNKPSYLIDLLITLVGNFIGMLVLSLLLKCTRLNPTLTEVATNIVNVKQNDYYLSIFIQAIMCGVMIYLAVEGHKKAPYPLAKVLFAYLPIVIFIACGFEHCVANVAYYTYAGVFDGTVVLKFLLMIVGNAIGSIIFDGGFKLINYLKSSNDNKKNNDKNDDNFVS